MPSLFIAIAGILGSIDAFAAHIDRVGISPRGAMLPHSDKGAAVQLGAQRLLRHEHHESRAHEVSRRERKKLQATSVLQESSAQLCHSLTKMIKEKRCTSKDVALFEEGAKLKSLFEWPLDDCKLPKPTWHKSLGRSPNCTVVFARSAERIEDLWRALPAGGLVIVPLIRFPGSSHEVSVEQAAESEDLIWQAMHQTHSRLYLSAAAGDDIQERLGLPGLQFSTFFKGYALLQKESEHDLPASQGLFYKLASTSGTDKVDSVHNYSLLYHRYLDGGEVHDTQGAMMLEIGLGCVLPNSTRSPSYAGGSAKIWPRLFPHTAVHFVDIDRECTARWIPQMRSAGVAKVHIGPQADPVLLQEIIHDAKGSAFRAVIDDGSHFGEDIEASFRGLFPYLSRGGLYFVEDISFSSFGTAHFYPDYWTRMLVDHKYTRTSATPDALAATLAGAVTGVAPASILAESVRAAEVVPPEAHEGGQFSHPVKANHSLGFFEKIFDKTLPGDMMEPHFGRIPEIMSDTLWGLWSKLEPVFAPFRQEVIKSKPHAATKSTYEWIGDLQANYGSMLDLVECSPGICVIRRA